MTHESVQLVDRWRGGDETAAREIYDRYVSRLIALAASRISPALARRVEAEDVVQSVYRSFFARTKDDRLSVDNSGQLWGLLAAITVNKIRGKVRFHAADKRNVATEASIDTSASCFGLSPSELARDPSAEEAAALTEQYDLASQMMSDTQRQVFQMFLDGDTEDNIAKSIRRSTRTVRRELEQVRSILTTALFEAETEANS